MQELYNIAGYCRISVDEELDRDNTSIENQKDIISQYVHQRFPGSSLSFFEDRDRSGYTFEQRESYQRMRRLMVSHKIDILVIKDFSRFSRRNSRGLVELEDLRDYGIRIISIGDGIDFPDDDDWLKIQFQFLINEMPVTDASKKVRAVIRRRQQEGRWICSAPYGYLINARQEFEIVPAEAEIVRLVYRLYQQGWGYKRIANYLTDTGIPTPRMSERVRREAQGQPCRREAGTVWAIATVQGMLENDFYTGTMRCGKYVRGKINGREHRTDQREHIVIQDHHQAIIGAREFAAVREMAGRRSRSHYRGEKKYENTYSGFLECRDCGSPMFALSRCDLKEAYHCGLYHRRGRKGCTSHHIRTEMLDEVVKLYVRKLRDHSSAMLEQLNASLLQQDGELEQTRTGGENLQELLAGVQQELKETKRQRIRDILRHPGQEELLEETYDELEEELARRISGLQRQLALTMDRRDTILQANRAAKPALEVFDDLLSKQRLDREDLELVVERIRVGEGCIEVMLKPDIDALLQGDDAAGCAHPHACDRGLSVTQAAAKHTDRVFSVNLISEGDPLEIFTDKDGGVVFKKYSLMGDLQIVASQICETVCKTSGCSVVICDRDSVIACAGVNRREVMERHISSALEGIMEARQVYQHRPGAAAVPLLEDGEGTFTAALAAPILTEGDVMGCVVFSEKEQGGIGEAEYKLAQTIAAFLGKHMES